MQLDTKVPDIGFHHLAVLRVEGARPNDSVAPPAGPVGIDAQRHQDRFTRGGRAVIERRVGHLHAGQLHDKRLELEHRLQVALADLGLVRSVGRQKLAPRDQRVNHHGTEVRVGTCAEEGHVVARAGARRLAEKLEDFRFRKRAGQVQAAAKPQLLRNLGEEFFDGFVSGGAQHGGAIGVRVREVAHYN